MVDSALCAFTCSCTCRFLSISKKMNTLWFTLSRAAKDLIAFLVGYVLVAAGVVGLWLACMHAHGFCGPPLQPQYLFESASLHAALLAIFWKNMRAWSHSWTIV